MVMMTMMMMMMVVMVMIMMTTMMILTTTKMIVMMMAAAVMVVVVLMESAVAMRDEVSEAGCCWYESFSHRNGGRSSTHTICRTHCMYGKFSSDPRGGVPRTQKSSPPPPPPPPHLPPQPYNHTWWEPRAINGSLFLSLDEVRT